MRTGDLVAQRFEIQRLAGEGGMGAVFQARDLTTGGAVALKVLHETRLKQSARFLREARLLSELDHPAIVRYVAHGETESGRAYLAMEWLAGESLGERLDRGRLTISESVRLALRVADALGAAHAREIVHRDLKPSNLFLVGGDIDRVMLVDFGIARLPGQTQLTDTGAMLGTVGYMAPEQARGDAGVDARADVYALGAVLFRCLTGRAVFEGDDPIGVLVRSAQEDAQRASAQRPAVPATLDDVVARLLARSPDARPRDGGVARQLLETLDSATLAHADGAEPAAAAEPSAPAGRPPLAPEATTLERVERAWPNPVRRGKTRRMALIAAAMLGVAGGAAVFAVTRRAPVPCYGERCRPVEVRNAAAVDMTELLGPAAAFATSVEPSARMSTAFSVGVRHGAFDSREPAGGVTIQFTFPRPAAPRGEEHGTLQVAYQSGQLALYRGNPLGFALPTIDGARLCSSRDAWRAAEMMGLPPDATATLALGVILDHPIWSLSIPTGPNGVPQAWQLDAVTCEPARTPITEPPMARQQRIELRIVNERGVRVDEVIVEHGNDTFSLPSLAAGETHVQTILSVPTRLSFFEGGTKIESSPELGVVELSAGCRVDIVLRGETLWSFCPDPDGAAPGADAAPPATSAGPR